MNRYVIKTNGASSFPNGVCRPRSVAEWDGGELHCSSNPALTREGKKQDAPPISEGDELWLWAHEGREWGNGWGLTAKATAGPLRVNGDRLSITLRDTELLPRPFSFKDVGQGASGSQLFDFLRQYRGETTYLIDNDDYDDFVRLVERWSSPIGEEEQSKYFSPRAAAIRNHKSEIIAASEEQRLGLQKLRPFQQRFRDAQMARHGGRCVVSRCNVPEALEAAHVVPHTGAEEFEVPENGLLLRSDLHKLFDRYLWSIHPGSARICVSERLRDTGYAKLSGRRVEHRLAPEFVSFHFDRFENAEREES